MIDNYEIAKAIEEVKATLVSMESDGRHYASEYLSKESLAVCMNALDIIKSQQAEIERLQKKVEELSEVLSDSIRIRYKEVKSEAVKEFAESLKKIIRLDDDYDKPLEVRWLCFKCHREWHKTHDNPDERRIQNDR